MAAETTLRSRPVIHSGRLRSRSSICWPAQSICSPIHLIVPPTTLLMPSHTLSMVFPTTSHPPTSSAPALMSQRIGAVIIAIVSITGAPKRVQRSTNFVETSSQFS